MVGGANPCAVAIALAPRACRELFKSLIERRTRSKPLDRVFDGDGKRCEDLREPVSQRAALIRGPDGYGHAGAQLHAVRTPPARAQEGAERAGHDREHHVVDRPAERFLDRLELLEAGAHHGDPPVRSGRHVERRVRWGVEGHPRDVADALDHLARPREQVLRARRRSKGSRRHLRRRLHGAQQPGRRELGGARGRFGHPRRRGLARGRPLDGQVEKHRREVDARDAVDHGVMGLREHREPARSEALDEPQLPQRLGAVEGLGEDPAGEVEQRPLRAGRRQPGVADVEGEVEARIVDPQRPSGVQRRGRELLPVARDEAQARLDVRQELVDPRGADLRAAAPRRCAYGSGRTPGPGSARPRPRGGRDAAGPCGAGY
jgi:hypothetical protein